MEGVKDEISAKTMPGSGELDSELQINEPTDGTGVPGEPQSEDDADINQILEELLPRATSAPPQLAELQKVYGIAPDTGAFAGSAEGDVAVKPFEDIRRDEDYEEFYKVYSGVKKLPPPVENLQLYTDSPKFTAREGEMGADGGFFGGLALDDSKLRESMEEMRRQDAERVQNEGGSANGGATPGSGGDGTDEEAFLEEMQRQVAQQQALQERELSRKALADKRPGQDASGANGLATAFQGLGVGGSTPVVRDASSSNGAADSGSGHGKAGSQQHVSSPSGSHGSKGSPVVVGTANVGGFMGGMGGMSALGSSATAGISSLSGAVGGPGGIPPALAAGLLGGTVGLDPFTTAALLQAMGGASGASGASLEELLAAVGAGGGVGAAAGLAGAGLAGAGAAAGLPVGMGLSAAAAAFAAPTQNKDKAGEAGKGAAADASAKKAGSSAAGPAASTPGAPSAATAAASSPALAGAAGGALPGLGSPGLGSQGAGILGLDALLAQGGAGLLPGMLPGAAGIAPSNLHLYEQLLRARAGAPGVDLYGGMGGMAAAAAAAAGGAGPRGGFGMGMGLDGFGLGGLGAPMDAFSAAAALQAARMFPGANPADMLSAMGGLQQPQQVGAGQGEKDSKDKGGTGASQGVAAGSDVDMSSLLQAQQVHLMTSSFPSAVFLQMAMLQAQAQRLQALQQQVEEDLLMRQQRQQQQQLLFQQQAFLQEQQQQLLGQAANLPIGAAAAAAAAQMLRGGAPGMDLFALNPGLAGMAGGFGFPPATGAAGSGSSSSTLSGLCKFFAQSGYCARGESCPFLHSMGGMGLGAAGAGAGGIGAAGGGAGIAGSAPQGVTSQAGYRVGAAPYVSPDRGPRGGGGRGTPPGFGGSSAGAARGAGGGGSGAPGMLGPGGGGMRNRMDGASGANGLMGPGPGAGLGGGELGSGSPPVGAYSGAGGLMGGYGVGGMGMGLGSAQHSKYSSLDEVEGQMAVIAKDQHGCSRRHAYLRKEVSFGGCIQSILLPLAPRPQVSPAQVRRGQCGGGGAHIQGDQAAHGGAHDRSPSCTSLPSPPTTTTTTMPRAPRFLQRKFDEGTSEEVARIFVEIKPHMVELMTDPFGNYLVQKALEVCSDVQREEILAMATENQTDLVSISLNMHGTRSVQKLIETVTNPQAVQRLTASLAGGVVTLIKDLNGNHVVQRCLQRLSAQQNEFIFNAAVSHCVEIASHRHGCCVLQRCIDFAQGQQKNRILAEVASNALVLSQDPFGNYVVQYVLDLGLPWAMEEVVVRLQGQYAPLAQQKFSSNVVEKCLKLAPDNCRCLIIQELVVSPLLGQLLQDPFANYVVQSALTVAKGPLYTALVEAIRPHLPSLRSSPYGKRILARTNLRPK
ncbi:unnamed protein product [Closterium sp. NIES-54]